VYGAQLAIIEGQEKIYLKALALMDNDWVSTSLPTGNNPSDN
jgi:hypothetical protein